MKVAIPLGGGGGGSQNLGGSSMIYYQGQSKVCQGHLYLAKPASTVGYNG